ncbi:hypothetical protein [Saccharopolyspora spinosa]|uniref:hypothetical protein n=1 Tax=Saccharopolyspora spinosa TaxID=60894 RepID=UPI0002378966|nr:hypothetical protein [Saccharopolyspora spinosa]
MARDGDRSGFSRDVSRIDPFCWIPVAPMLLLALATVLMGVPLLGLLLLILALAIVGFDMWVNNRRKSSQRRLRPSAVSRRVANPPAVRRARLPRHARRPPATVAPETGRPVP